MKEAFIIKTKIIFKLKLIEDALIIQSNFPKNYKIVIKKENNSKRGICHKFYVNRLKKVHGESKIPNK